MEFDKLAILVIVGLIIIFILSVCVAAMHYPKAHPLTGATSELGSPALNANLKK